MIVLTEKANKTNLTASRMDSVPPVNYCKFFAATKIKYLNSRTSSHCHPRKGCSISRSLLWRDGPNRYWHVSS